MAGEVQPASSTWLYDRVLADMVGKGLGLEAISAYLRISAEAVLDRVVDLGLPTPHDRPLRRSGHPNAWPVAEILLFIDCWLQCWNAASAAEAFGRSSGSIYGLARRLGLPRRDRRKIRRPGSAAVERVRQTRSAPSSSPSSTERCTHRFASLEPPERTQAAPSAPSAQTVLALEIPTNSPPTIRRRAGIGTVVWTTALDENLSMRRHGNQHYKAIAADLGLSARAVSQRLYVLGMPPVCRRQVVHHFDAEAAAKNRASSPLRWRRCTFNTEQFFWSSGAGDRVSRVSKRSKAYKARMQVCAFAP